MATRQNTRASEFAYTFVGDIYVCAYCGDPADTEDHTVPAWFVASNPKLILTCKLYKVAACRDCNARAGARVDRTFLQRKRRIAANIRKRFKGFLSVADWTGEELADLGPRLRDYVVNSIHGQRHLHARLEMLDSGLFPRGMPMFFFSGVRKASEEQDD